MKPSVRRATIVSLVSSCSTLPTVRTACTMECDEAFSVLTPMRWILSRLTLTVYVPNILWSIALASRWFQNVLALEIA